MKQKSFLHESHIGRLHQRELSYAEQRAEGTLSKSTHKELVLRLKQEKKELLEVRAQLQNKAEQLAQARLHMSSADKLIEQLPEVLPNIQRRDKEKLIMALISRIDVDADTKVSITQHLHADGLVPLSRPQSAAFPRQ